MGRGRVKETCFEPASAADGALAVLLTGVSAFGLAAADGVVRYLEERRIGLSTRAGVVPLVAGAVVYDLAWLSGCPAGCGWRLRRLRSGGVGGGGGGSVGAGTGCTSESFLGPTAG